MWGRRQGVAFLDRGWRPFAATQHLSEICEKRLPVGEWLLILRVPLSLVGRRRWGASVLVRCARSAFRWDSGCGRWRAAIFGGCAGRIPRGGLIRGRARLLLVALVSRWVAR